MNDSDRLVLRQILEYCEIIAARIDEFGVDENLFVENSAYFDMLLMPVFQIGELANALSRDFTETDAMPWHAINGFRNIIAHDYGVVDPLWAWNTIQTDIPALATHLKNTLE